MEESAKKTRRSTSSYVAGLAFKLALRGWKTNLIVFISLVLGTVVMLTCVSFIFRNIKLSSRPFSQPAEKVLIYYGIQGQTLSPEQEVQLVKAMGASSFAITTVEYSVSVPELRQNETYFVLGVQGDAKSIFTVPMSEGRYFNKEEIESDKTHKCIVGKEISDVTGVGVGDSITLLGQAYEIIGIGGLRSGDFTILVPERAYGADEPEVESQQTFYLAVNEPPQGKAMEIFLRKNKIDASKLEQETGQQLKDREEQQLFRSIKEYGKLMIITALIVTMNIFIVTNGKMRNKQYLYAIERALGGKNSDVILQFFCENLILSLLALVTAFLAMPAVVNIIDRPGLHYTDLPVILITLGLVLLIGAASSIYSGTKALHTDINATLCNEGAGI